MTLEEIKEVFDTIRPNLQADGGDAELVELTDDRVLHIRLLGHCHGCMHARATVKMGIERYLVQYFPELRAVEAVD